MKYSYKQFLQDVTSEVESIKLNATAQEKSRLSFGKFRPSDMTQCIYGQMTGHCSTDRATELIEISCQRYIINDGYDCTKNTLLRQINESKIKDLYEDRQYIEHFSALEAYILLEEANNENVIAYIKGETDTLKL